MNNFEKESFGALTMCMNPLATCSSDLRNCVFSAFCWAGSESKLGSGGTKMKIEIKNVNFKECTKMAMFTGSVIESAESIDCFTKSQLTAHIKHV